MKRVGFIINSRIPRGRHALFGWDDAGSPMSFMRFRWIARELRDRVVYELYRPWRRYDAVVFLKSMGPQCMELLERVRGQGSRVVFEANVDYYSHSGEELFSGMNPTPEQRENATAITQAADAVIASSSHLARICSNVRPGCHWVPDNVPSEASRPLPTAGRGPLPVWWSGMAAKLADFLAIEAVLRDFASRVKLHLVTDDYARASSRWSPETRARIESLFGVLSPVIHPFKDIANLQDLYAQGGGVIVSPRFLDNPYNLSHSEWKITLGMGVGLPALASPVPSYCDVAERAPEGAIRICRSDEEWREAFDAALSGARLRADAARAVVERHYSTPVVARQHAEVIEAL